MPPTPLAQVQTTRVLGSPTTSDQPLVEKIRAEFKRCCRDGFDKVTADDLAQRWIIMAESTRCDDDDLPISSEGRETISLRARQLFEEMELKGENWLSMEDWVHYVLLSRCNIATAQVNTLLQSVLLRRPHILHDLMRVFHAADTNNKGVLTLSEVVAMYSQQCWNFNATDSQRPLSLDELRLGDPQQFAQDIIEVMDLDGDERITYAEFTAFVLGRRKEEVLLHVYDISKGMADSLTPYLLGEQLKGIWHTGVVVFGKEYFFSSNTMTDRPGNTVFGKPTYVVTMGWTLWREDEVDMFVCTDLKPRFQRSTYDIVTCNCNHFTDHLLMYLNGKHPPEEIMRQPEVLLSSPFVRIIRPLMNHYLRERVVSRQEDELSIRDRRLKSNEHVQPGTVVALHGSSHLTPILGHVCTEQEARVFGVSMYSAPETSWRCHASAQPPQDGIWVRYFDIQPADLTPGKLRIELIPRMRISVPPVGQLPNGTDIFSV